MSDETAASRYLEALELHQWQTEMLMALGVPRYRAIVLAGLVDWHDLAALVEDGCPVDLAVKILMPP